MQRCKPYDSSSEGCFHVCVKGCACLHVCVYNVNVLISIWKGHPGNLLLTDLLRLIKVTKWPVRWNEIKPSCILDSALFSAPLMLSLPVCFSSCSVFLLDRVSHELVAKVFDGGVVSDEEVQHTGIRLHTVPTIIFHPCYVFNPHFLYNYCQQTMQSKSYQKVILICVCVCASALVREHRRSFVFQQIKVLQVTWQPLVRS